MTIGIFQFNRISLLFQMIFLYKFTPHRYGRKLTICIIAVGFALESICDACRIYLNMPSFAKSLLLAAEIAAVLGTAFFICKYHDLRPICVGVTSAVFVLPCDFLCSQMWLRTGSFVLAVIIQVSTMILFLRLMRHLYAKKVARELTIRQNNWVLVALVPSMFYLIILSLSIPGTAPAMPRDVNTLAVMMLIILMCVVICAGIDLLAEKSDFMEQKNARLFYKASADGLKKNIETLKDSNERLSKIQHDSKHYTRMVLAMLDEGNYEAARQAVAKKADADNRTHQVFLCENITINSILSSFQVMAGKENVRFECQADVPGSLPDINEYELAIALSNMIDNAIRAAADCRNDTNTDVGGAVSSTSAAQSSASIAPSEANDSPTDRFVNIHIVPIKGMLAISIRNSYSGAIAIADDTGLPMSHHGAGHGYGMNSINSFADKYGATFTWSTDNHIFTSKLLIKM